MRWSCLTCFVIACSFGCGGEPIVEESSAPIPMQLPPGVEDDQLLSDAARRLVAVAASITKDQLDAVLISPAGHELKSQPLSVVLLGLDPSTRGTDAAEVGHDFAFLTAEPPLPSTIAKMAWNEQDEYVSLVQPHFVQACECHSEAGVAHGTFTFEAPGLYRGCVEFSARRHQGKWGVYEFRLPHYGIKTSRGTHGEWIQASL